MNIYPPLAASPDPEPPFAISSYRLSIKVCAPSLYAGFAAAQSAADPTRIPELNRLPAILPSPARPAPAKLPNVDVSPYKDSEDKAPEIAPPMIPPMIPVMPGLLSSFPLRDLHTWLVT